MEDKLREYVYSIVDKNDPAHRRDHIERVYELGMLIGKEEEADLTILAPALLLHDIIRPTDEEQEIDHALESARIARNILVRFNYKKIDEIINAIIKSSTSNSKQTIPDTLEAKILFDADKIDGIGYIGIERAKRLWSKRFVINKQRYDEKIVARWYLKKIIKVARIGLFTNKGREIANERIVISLNYCKNILKGEYYQIVSAPAGI